jgi:hypothetical protein
MGKQSKPSKGNGQGKLSTPTNPRIVQPFLDQTTITLESRHGKIVLKISRTQYKVGDWHELDAAVAQPGAVLAHLVCL